jgi:hypothetical protein
MIRRTIRSLCEKGRCIAEKKYPDNGRVVD